MGRDAKSIELAKKKVEYVKELVKDDPKLTMNAVGAQVHKRFGSRLYPGKLREAFVAAGGKVLRRGKKGRRGNAKTMAAKVPKNGRRSVGRRRADKAASRVAKRISALQSYVVLVQSDGAPQVHTFSDSKKAEDYIQQQLAMGVPLTSLGCYLRQPLAVEFEV